MNFYIKIWFAWEFLYFVQVSAPLSPTVTRGFCFIIVCHVSLISWHILHGARFCNNNVAVNSYFLFWYKQLVVEKLFSGISDFFFTFLLRKYFFCTFNPVVTTFILVVWSILIGSILLVPYFLSVVLLYITCCVSLVKVYSFEAYIFHRDCECCPIFPQVFQVSLYCIFA